MSLGDTGKGVVIPFHAARTGLWAAQREWVQTVGPLPRRAARMVELLDDIEQGLKAVEAALQDPHPAPARLCSFLRGDLSGEDTRAVVRHLLTGCPDCSEALRPLLGQAKLPLAREEWR